MSVERTCPVCDSKDWSNLLGFSDQRSMTSDHRIIQQSLSKVICGQCGLGANEFPWSDESAKKFYSDEYVLNTGSDQEHHFFSQKTTKPRSQVYFEWIKPFISDETKSILEIGCGDGKVLSQIMESFPHAQIEGLDGSHASVARGVSTGLNIRQGLIQSEKDIVERKDLFIAIGVVEHVPDLLGFLTALLNSGDENSMYVFTFPIQNGVNQDILFSDHEWHFGRGQALKLFDHIGFNVIEFDDKNQANPGMALVIANVRPQIKSAIDNDSLSINKSAAQHWTSRLNQVEKAIKNLANQQFIIFGASEFFELTMTYTSLYKRLDNVDQIIDETPGKAGQKAHGIPISGLEYLNLSSLPIVVLANPVHNEVIKEKLSQFSNQVHYIL